MKVTHVLAVSLLLVAQKMSAQTADDYVNQGLSYLQSSNVVAANLSFATAVSLSPTNQSANALYGVTRLLVLPYQPTGSNFLTRLGMPEAGRDVYNWTAKLPADTNGVVLAPAGVDASEVSAVLRTNILTAVIDAEANLASVTDTNFLLSLSARQTPMGPVQVDYGDILLLRAALAATEYFGYTVNSFNLQAQFAALRALYLSDGLNPGEVLERFPELFTFSTTNDLAAAKLAFSNAVDLYLQASSFIRARPISETRLFNYDLAQANKESDFRRLLSGLQSALNGATRLDVGQHLTVDLSPIFDGLHPWRSFLPQFSGGDYILGTLDPTFQGVVTGLDLASEESFMARSFSAVPNFAAGGFVQGQFVMQLNVLPGRGYAIESSPDLLNWTVISHEYSTDAVMIVTQPPGGSQGVFYRAREESNDRLAAAYTIQGLPATSIGSNEGATSESGDPTNYFSQVSGFGPPVWWSWTATVSGLVGVSATAPRFNPVLGVFTGSSLADLSPVVDLTTDSSEFDFQAIAGATYFIAAESGYYVAQGAIQLSLAASPQNDDFANRATLTGATASVIGCNILATEEPNEPYGGGHSVWYSWTAPASGSVAVSATGVAYPFVSIFTGNDPGNLAEVTMAYSGEGSFFDAIAGTTYQIRVDGYQTGNFTLGISASPGRYPLFVSASPSEGGALVLKPAPGTDGMYAAGTIVTITAQPFPGFVFGGFNGSISTSGGVTQVSFPVNGSQSVYGSFYPANDNFAQSTLLAGSSGSISGSTEGASSEPGEPGFNYETVWYSWVAPVSGSVTFWIAGAYLPQFNVYTGDFVTNLTSVSIFSSGRSHGVASQTFDVVANTTYHLQIAGYGPSFELLFRLSGGFFSLSDSASPTEGGTILVDPPPSSDGLYAQGTAVTLVAQPAHGFEFVDWDGAGNSSTQLVVTMNESQRHSANFRLVGPAGFGELYSFHGADGANPYCQAWVLSGNTIFGTTYYGGLGQGVIFAVNADGTGFRDLYRFNGGSDGGSPTGVILSGNTLYGTAFDGGTSGNGNIFAVHTDGTGFTNLHTFSASFPPFPETNGDGIYPNAVVLIGDTLYGTAYRGGRYGNGTIFAINTNGTGFKTLHSLAATNDGAYPPAGLMSSGNLLFGTASAGGREGKGTIFSIHTDGSGFTNLYSFGGVDAGSSPNSPLVLAGNTLYGTTYAGGASSNGMVFALHTDGTGFRSLHDFTAVDNSYGTNIDGAQPEEGLVLSGNAVYGTTLLGGNSGGGTIFSVHVDGSGYTNFYSFSALSSVTFTNADGANPSSYLILSGNLLYGLASEGGKFGAGSVFSVPLP